MLSLFVIVRSLPVWGSILRISCTVPTTAAPYIWCLLYVCVLSANFLIFSYVYFRRARCAVATTGRPYESMKDTKFGAYIQFQFLHTIAVHSGPACICINTGHLEAKREDAYADRFQVLKHRVEEDLIDFLGMRTCVNMSTHQ